VIKNVCFSYTEEVFQLERELDLARLRLDALESVSHECECAGRCDFLDSLSEAKIAVDNLSMRVDYLTLLEFQDLARIAAENEEKEREAFEKEEKERIEEEERRRAAEETEKERKEREEQEERERAEREEWERARREHVAEQIRLEEEALEEEARLAREAAFEREAAEERERLEREIATTSTADDSFLSVGSSEAEEAAISDLSMQLNSSCTFSNDSD